MMKRKKNRRAGMSLFLVILILTLQTTIAFAGDEVIAHGGGSYRGYDAGSALETVIESIKKGIKLIELDMNLTADGEIAMVHDWDATSTHYLGEKLNGPISLSEFEKLAVFGSLQPLTMEKLIEILKEFPDVRIITDTKSDTEWILQKIAKDYPAYKNQFIPQIYFFEQYPAVKKAGYKDIILTTYLQANPDAQKIIDFAKKEKLYGVTMPNYSANGGLCQKIAASGVNVFVHPINSVEDANHFFSMGAKKIYTPNLLPKEFDGIEKEYYLVNESVGKAKKLVDSTFQGAIAESTCELVGKKELYGIKGLYLTGLKQGESAQCDLVPYTESGFRDLGVNELNIQINSNTGVNKGQLNYFLCNTQQGLRILQDKLSYRLEQEKIPKDFNATLELGEAKNILAKSIIVKNGEAIYYDCGNSKVFKNNGELFPVSKVKQGYMIIPLRETINSLGGTNVSMEANKDVVFSFKNEKYRVPMYSCSMKNTLTTIRLNNPLKIVLHKAMASGDFFEKVTGREYIDQDDIMIILPENLKPGMEMKTNLLLAAQKLF